MKTTIKVDGHNIPIEALDISDLIGENGRIEEAEWPMRSFSRPAYNFWNGVARGLARQGLTIKEIKWWLQSKNARYLLDEMVDDIRDMGEQCGRDVNLVNVRKEMQKEVDRDLVI